MANKKEASPIVSKRGASPIVNNFVGIAIAVIMGLGVTVAVINSTLASSNLTGINATVAGFLPTFVIVGLLVLIVNVVM